MGCVPYVHVDTTRGSVISVPVCVAAHQLSQLNKTMWRLSPTDSKYRQTPNVFLLFMHGNGVFWAMKVYDFTVHPLPS